MLPFSGHDVTINIQALFLTRAGNNPALCEFPKLICVNKRARNNLDFSGLYAILYKPPSFFLDW